MQTFIEIAYQKLQKVDKIADQKWQTFTKIKH
jgi:hypothetical protein